MFIILLWCCLAMLSLVSCSKNSNQINPYFKNFGSATTICPPNATCLDYSYNFLCYPKPYKPHPRCSHFRLLKTTRRVRTRMVHAHNGLRNKVAEDFNVVNMNLVYWNENLQEMAEAYVYQCRMVQDTCLVIGNDAELVNQNIVTTKLRTYSAPPYWTARAVRTWYLQIGPHVNSFDDFLKEFENGDLDEFTQLIWPTLEFIGCAGAIQKVKELFVVCYYYPPMDTQHIKSVFLRAKEGSDCICPETRLMCSKLFIRLCGVDLIVDNGANKFKINCFLALFWIQFLKLRLND